MPSKAASFYLLTVPLNSSCFWRPFHLFLSCRCHSGVCVIRPINNRFKIRLKCIALSKGITQTFLGCCPWQLLMLYQLNKNWHRFHEWLFVCTNFILCTHQTTLLVPQYWHHTPGDDCCKENESLYGQSWTYIWSQNSLSWMWQSVSFLIYVLGWWLGTRNLINLFR